MNWRIEPRTPEIEDENENDDEFMDRRACNMTGEFGLSPGYLASKPES
jgi:hypothetical protein